MSFKEMSKAALCILVLVLFGLFTDAILRDSLSMNQEKSMTYAIIISLFIGSMMVASSENNRMVTCHLCQNEVRKKHYEEHRETCANEYTEYLSSMQTVDGLTCPLCQEQLRLWPKHSTNSMLFTCSDAGSCSIKSNTDIRNNGSNCFHCFKCNYFKCIMCVFSESPHRLLTLWRFDDEPTLRDSFQMPIPSSPPQAPPSYDVAISMPPSQDGPQAQRKEGTQAV